MFRKLFTNMIEARQRHANQVIARDHLRHMSDRELQDIGINRGDINRVVSATRTHVRSSS